MPIYGLKLAMVGKKTIHFFFFFFPQFFYFARMKMMI
jgi:hypothetical protein